MKHQSYMNRALKARDPRYARILGKLGYSTAALTTETGEPQTPLAITIPVDWRDLAWPQLKSLAGSVSDEKIKTKDDAVAAIELEIERREKANS